jgi:DNA invertase Pin-like site-specific DNA recombinase
MRGSFAKIICRGRGKDLVRRSTCAFPENRKNTLSKTRRPRSRYAARRGIEIVKAYADRLSGLRIAGRDALRELIKDVELGRTQFDCILVYDVSRWGRFQDVDESAYYEFSCKRAGIHVHYCAYESLLRL